MGLNGYIETYLDQVVEVAKRLDRGQIEGILEILLDVRKKGGRLFFLGVGGSAGNAAHAVNDFRKIADIECYAPTDNVSELTARVNDNGWETVFSDWLKGSRIGPNDAVFVFSVGGGNLQKNVSPNIVAAVQLAKAVKARVVGIVGRDGGYTAKVADACVVVPTVDPETVTPHAEAFQAVLFHLLVSHPALKAHGMKWESLSEPAALNA